MNADEVELLIIMFNLAIKLHKGDIKKASEWLTTENSYFFNHKPIDLFFIGQDYVVVDFLKARVGDETKN